MSKPFNPDQQCQTPVLEGRCPATFVPGQTQHSQIVRIISSENNDIPHSPGNDLII